MTNDSTVYIQTSQDVRETMTCTCDSCNKPLSECYETDKYGYLEVYVDFDNEGNLIGFLCPSCYRRGKNDLPEV